MTIKADLAVGCATDTCTTNDCCTDDDGCAPADGLDTVAGNADDAQDPANTEADCGTDGVAGMSGHGSARCWGAGSRLWKPFTGVTSWGWRRPCG